jgi:hypothetical protein
MTSPRGGATKRVYRSKEQAILSAIIGMIGLGAAIGLLIESKKAAGAIFTVLYFVVSLPIIFRFACSHISTSENGVHVVNVLSGSKIRWEEIETFSIGRWTLLPYVCLIHLRNGEAKHAVGIQERTNFADGSGEKLVGELNAELRGYTAGFGEHDRICP